MDDTFCFRGALILPDAFLSNAFLVVEEGRIKSIETQRPSRFNGPIVELNDGYVSPGFIDIHVHGGSGADYMDGNAAAVRTIGRAHLRHGTTTIFPTTTTGSNAQLRRMIDACIEVREAWSARDGAYIGGIHFYGPYFAEGKVGCHSPEGRRDPVSDEYRPFFNLKVIRVATCAAELPGAEEFYRTATESGCLVTCGHSDASWAEMARAFEAG